MVGLEIEEGSLWFNALVDLSFIASMYDTPLFILDCAEMYIGMLIYVDDIIVT